MSNPLEAYAFVTNQGWTDHLAEQYPHAISVGADYRMIQFTKADEPAMIQFAESLGFVVKYLSATDTVAAMESQQLGPFIIYGDDVHAIVDHFNPVTEI